MHLYILPMHQPVRVAVHVRPAELARVRGAVVQRRRGQRQRARPPAAHDLVLQPVQHAERVEDGRGEPPRDAGQPRREGAVDGAVAEGARGGV